MTTPHRKIRVSDDRWNEWQKRLDEEPNLASNRTQAIKEAMNLYLADAAAGRHAYMAVEEGLRHQELDLDPSLVEDEFEELSATLDDQYRLIDQLSESIDELTDAIDTDDDSN